MRTGIVLDGRVAAAGRDGVVDLARRVEDLGFDLVWLRAGPGLHDPFVVAPFVAAATRGLRIGVEVGLGDLHPVLVAESAAVCDLAVGGRLVLALRPDPDVGDDFARAVEVVLRAHRPRPFRVEDGPWPVPANLPENRFMRDRMIRVTPAPAQFELPTWLVDAPEVAAAFGLAAVLDDPGAGPGHWGPRDAADGARAWRLSRPAVVSLPDASRSLDPDPVVAGLLEAASHWGMDTVLFDLADPAGRTRVLEDLAHLVRPRIQQERLPSGLLDWWDTELRADEDPEPGP